ncbi:MAG: type 1 glutamine amidotransferase [Candidatus Aminicenantes bacterium]|jgi:GMP synthase-like glutamine amidotransferase
MRNKTRVAIIDNSIDPSIYTPVVHWTAFLESEWQAFTAREYKFPDLEEGFTHVILTGSEASILERDRWVDPEIELTLEAVERKIPVLGSCWGHQLLAIALAGPCHVQRSGYPEIGWTPITITEENALVGHRGQEFVFCSHFDEVVDLDEDFSVFASSDKCRVHAFQWKKHPVWGIQSHPEMSIREAQLYLQRNVESAPGAHSIYLRALNSAPKDTGMVLKVIRNFLNCSPGGLNR